MSKYTKVIPAPTVYVDNFELKDIQIIAYTLVDGKPIDFHINQDEFETWVDDQELRDYEMNIPSCEDGVEKDVMCTISWPDVYECHRDMIYQFLKAYIEFMHEQESMDFQPALNKILSTHKAAI